MFPCFNGLFKVRPIPFRPFPFRPNFSRFAYSFFALSNFALFSFRPMSVLPFCRFAVSPNFIFADFSFRPEANLPNFPISPNDHFALFPHGPIPNAIFLISGPKTYTKFSNKLILQFWTLILRLLWNAHIMGEEDILIHCVSFINVAILTTMLIFGSF